MALRTCAFLVFILSAALPLCPAAAVEPSAIIRPVHGPLPPSRIPPFAATAAALLLAGVTFWRVRGRRAASPAIHPSGPAPEYLAAMLATIEYQYRLGEIPAPVLFDRLVALIRSHLASQTGTGTDHLTNEELLVTARALLSHDSLTHVAALLTLCDNVRFGAFQPDASQIRWAVSTTEQLMQLRSRVHA